MGPGRVGHIEDVISRGDVLDVVVQEVDKARGRIGLKLVGSTRTAPSSSLEELDAPRTLRHASGASATATAALRRGGGGGRGGGRGRDS